MASRTLPDHLNSLLLLLLLFPLLPCVLAVNETDCKFPFNTSLSTNSSPLLSPSGDFAFGFHDLAGDKKHFLLAIWFNKIQNKTVVWSANGDAKELAPEGSEVKLTDNGEFVLNDRQGKQLWKAKTNVITSTGTCVALQDVGNLVLVNKDYKPIWESFKEPNDTMLPGQILDMDGSLVSRVSKQNYSKGSYKLRMQRGGNLVLYSVSVSTVAGDDLVATMASGSMQGSISQLIFDEAGDIYIKERSKGVERRSILTRAKPGSAQYYYHLARIDSDGVLRIYEHPKENTSSCECRLSWCTVKEIPDDICIVSRVCRFNSYCVKNYKNASSFDCLCPNGYSYLDLSDPSKGCKPDFPLPRCQTDGWETNKDIVRFEKMNNTDWPFSDYELQTGKEVNLEKCQQFCQDDCFCVAAIFNGENCWKKRYPLTNGRQSNRTNRIALLKVPISKENIRRQSKNKRDKSTLILPGSILLGISGIFNVLLLIAIGVALLFSYQRKLKDLQSVSSVSSTNLRSYTYKDLEDATRGFKNLLGRGAFGSVYKGVLGSYPKRFVAIKKLERVERDGEKEFKTEVTVIGQTHHKNLVRLLGYCDEGDQRLLVYEYMSNGSLASFLFGISRPDWNQRVQIAFGIARGLMYLHEECSTQIIHCDIKPQNILLDDNFTPRIADFGLAKLMLDEQTRVARTAIRGTVGYFAPEWFRKASITVKVDVYSFGVMLLEIICRKSSVSFAMQNEEEDALVDWAYDCYKERRLDKLVEDDEEARIDLKRVERIVMVAIWCIQEEAALRPSMKKVSQMLEGVIPVSVPPAPSNYT